MTRPHPSNWRCRRLGDVLQDVRRTVMDSRRTVAESRALLAKSPSGLLPREGQGSDADARPKD
jgi:hypothetical protein